MKIILVSKCSLDIEQYVELKMSVLISPSKSLISSRWVTYVSMYGNCVVEASSFTLNHNLALESKQNSVEGPQKA